MNPQSRVEGTWKLSVDDEWSDFHYSRAKPTRKLRLMSDYFKVNMHEPSGVTSLDIQDKHSLIRFAIELQGVYEGHFVYNGSKIKEKYSLMFVPGEKPNAPFKAFGYGKNDSMGCFVLEGKAVLEGVNE